MVAEKAYVPEPTSRLIAPSTAAPLVTPATPLTNALFFQTGLPPSVTVVDADLTCSLRTKRSRKVSL